MRVSKTEMPDALVQLCFSEGVDIKWVNPQTVVSTSRPRRRALGEGKILGPAWGWGLRRALWGRNFNLTLKGRWEFARFRLWICLEEHSRRKEQHMQSLEVGRSLTHSERPACLRMNQRQAGPAPAGLEGHAKDHAVDFRSNERPMKIWKWGGLCRLYLIDILRSHTGCWEENRLSCLEELAQDLGGRAEWAVWHQELCAWLLCNAWQQTRRGCPVRQGMHSPACAVASTPLGWDGDSGNRAGDELLYSYPSLHSH